MPSRTAPIALSVDKTAGAVTHLVDAISGARLKCEELITLCNEAVSHIEDSKHKEHFFEVAGGLIRGIPDCVFDLHKELQTAALAANKLDYEEIKRDVPHSDVHTLEDSKEDIRVKQVRKNTPVNTKKKALTPYEVSTELNTLAKSAKKGEVKASDIFALIQALEPPLAVSNQKAAAVLTKLANDVVNPPTEKARPSRKLLASALQSLVTPIQIQARYEEGVPADPTENMEPEDAEEWRDNTEEYGDKFKTAVAQPLNSMAVDLTGKEMLETSRKILTYAKTKAYKRMMLHVYVLFQHINKIANAYGKALPGLAHATRPFFALSHTPKDPFDPVVVESLAELIVASSRKVALGPANSRRVLISTSAILSHLFQLSIQFGIDVAPPLNQVRKIFHSLITTSTPTVEQTELAPAPNKIKPFRNFGASEEEILSRYEEGKPADPTENMNPSDAKEWKENTDEYEDLLKDADSLSDSDDEVLSRYEEGKPADPTENMDQEDAKEWRENTDEYGDKFKAKLSWKV